MAEFLKHYIAQKKFSHTITYINLFTVIEIKKIVTITEECDWREYQVVSRELLMLYFLILVIVIFCERP